MGAPYGDYCLAGYSVQSEPAEIRLRAERCHPGKPRVTEIVFTGVEAYHFEHNNFGTILGHIIELPLPLFIEEQAESFRRGWHQSGWPSFWRNSVPDAIAFLESASVHAFELSSSIGMIGWILAREFQAHAVDDESA